MALGVLPLGTLNHFARDAGIPFDVEEAVKAVVHGRPVAVDVGEVNGRVFINNSSLGMVRQWQTLFYEGRYSNTDLHSARVPDFVKLAEALGCVGLRCETATEVDATITKAMEINDAPVVVDFIVNPDAMVWPMVPAGTSNDALQIARDLKPDFEDEA